MAAYIRQAGYLNPRPNPHSSSLIDIDTGLCPAHLLIEQCSPPVPQSCHVRKELEPAGRMARSGEISAPRKSEFGCSGWSNALQITRADRLYNLTRICVAGGAFGCPAEFEPGYFRSS